MDETKKQKPTIAELEAILDGPPCSIVILPNGELRTQPTPSPVEASSDLGQALGMVDKLRRRVMALENLLEKIEMAKVERKSGGLIGKAADILRNHGMPYSGHPVEGM